MIDNYLRLDPYTFDQSDKGWQILDKQGKYLEAAQLIGRYISVNLDKIKSQQKVSLQTLHFHAGQEYAMSGKEYYPEAISHFERSYKRKIDWDVYVKGTIAFLQQNKIILKECAEELRLLAKQNKLQDSNAELLSNFYNALTKDIYSYHAVYGKH